MRGLWPRGVGSSYGVWVEKGDAGGRVTSTRRVSCAVPVKARRPEIGGWGAIAPKEVRESAWQGLLLYSQCSGCLCLLGHNESISSVLCA